MDKACYKDIEKIKTIGSTYMAAVGLVPTIGNKVRHNRMCVIFMLHASPLKKQTKKTTTVYFQDTFRSMPPFSLYAAISRMLAVPLEAKKKRFLLEPLTDGTACGLTYKTSHHLAQISCQSKHQRVLFHPYWPLGAVLKTLNVHAEFEYAHQNSHLWPLNGYIFPTQSSRVNTRIPSNRTLRQSVRIHSNIVTV